MTLTISCFLIVCPMVFLAGFVDSIAGGGGLISLPAYLLAGVPMHNAIATNKLSSATGTAISTVRLCKNKFVDWGLALPCISMALLGSFVGALPVSKASGTMKLANLSSNVMALAVFLFSGKIVILLGLAASAFSIAGHYVGSGMVMKNGSKIVRPIILVVLALLFIKIIAGM